MKIYSLISPKGNVLGQTNVHIKGAGVQRLYIYWTLVAAKRGTKEYLYPGYNYSATTRRAVRRFLGYDPVVFKKKEKAGEFIMLDSDAPVPEEDL